MIGLVRLSPPDFCPGVERLDWVPEPASALHWAYLVLCATEEEVTEMLAWYCEVRAARPSVGFGLVCEPAICAAALGKATVPVSPVIAPDSLERDQVPPSVIEEMKAASVEGHILEDMLVKYGQKILKEQTIIEALIHGASRGVRLKRISRDVGLSEDTVRRRLQAVGLQPQTVMSQIRLRAYDLLLEMGDRPSSAALTCGWAEIKAQRKAAGRARGHL
jgi:AraC-like DNA-binding protein